MSIIKEISKEQAKKFLLLKHGLIGEHKFEGKQGIVDYVTQAGCVQYDPIDVCGKNHELVLFSKIKNFSKDDMYSLLYEERKLIDGLDKCMAIYLTSDWPYFEHERLAAKHSSPSKKEIDAVSDEILKYIEQNGPICSSDLKFDQKVDWYWAPTSLTRAALDRLFFRGDLVFHHKKNTRKYYDLAIRHLDNGILEKSNPNKSLDEILRWNILRRIGSVGMLHNNASYAFMGIHNMKSAHRDKIYKELAEEGAITEIQVEGVKNSFFYKTEDQNILDEALHNKEHESRIEFIAPLDNMMWDRKIIIELFDFDYKWEIYTPIKDRVYGYYVLPILYGTDFIGRIEFRRDKKAKCMKIENLWMDRENEFKDLISQKVDSISATLY
ncbi:MAG: crosslink repair DNA glycosylase YcaQ family protein [Eubacteriales bacterium]